MLELEAAMWHAETNKIDKAITKEALKLEKHRNPNVYIRWEDGETNICSSKNDSFCIKETEGDRGTSERNPEEINREEQEPNQ